MLISYFTPTHNPAQLRRVYNSLKAQINRNWEWVIVPNGGLSPLAVSDLLDSDDKRIEIIPYESKIIGELKNFSANCCTGDVVAELDHDDEVTPDCTDALSDVFTSYPDVDFAYSNFLELENGVDFTYDRFFGWEYRPFYYNGVEHKECVAFSPTPMSVSKIWYAPNHIRAWRKAFYSRIGGHNKTMDILDDQDILCRTYLLGKMLHIDRCLYVYHRHTNNTCLQRAMNDRIQVETLTIHDRYIYALVERWCEINHLIKLDIGGGLNPAGGYFVADRRDTADFKLDLNDDWDAIPDGMVGVIRAHDTLEHLKNPIHTMKQAYRKLATGGWLLTSTPSTDGRGAFQDPTHVSFWNSNSFWYYTKQDQARFIDAPVRFQLNRIKNHFPSKWHEIHNIPYVDAQLVKIGPEIARYPGGIQI